MALFNWHDLDWEAFLQLQYSEVTRVQIAEAMPNLCQFVDMKML